METVSTRSLGRTELCRCWRDRVGQEGSYQATQPPSKTLGLGSSAETTSASATIFCLPPLRNGALGGVARDSLGDYTLALLAAGLLAILAALMAYLINRRPLSPAVAGESGPLL